MKKQIIFDFYRTLYNPETNKLFRGILPLLKQLSNEYRLVLISTASSKRTEEVKNFIPKGLFAKIVLCAEKNLKNFKLLSLDYKETIIIGDRIEEEILIGQRLRLRTVQVNPGQENPSKTIKKALKGAIK